MTHAWPQIPASMLMRRPKLFELSRMMGTRSAPSAILQASIAVRYRSNLRTAPQLPCLTFSVGAPKATPVVYIGRFCKTSSVASHTSTLRLMVITPGLQTAGAPGVSTIH